jgi:hypothetical protein
MGFVGPWHLLSLGTFGDSKSIVGSTVYSALSGLIEGRGRTDNPNFIFYIPTATLARHRLRNVILSHTYHFTARLILEFWFFEVLYFILY